MEIDLQGSFRAKRTGNSEKRSLDSNLEACISCMCVSVCFCVCVCVCVCLCMCLTLSSTLHHVPPSACVPSVFSACNGLCSPSCSLPLLTLPVPSVPQGLSRETSPTTRFESIPSSTPSLPLLPLLVLLLPVLFIIWLFCPTPSPRIHTRHTIHYTPHLMTVGSKRVGTFVCFISD